jgi:hypothetical protein
MNATKVYLVEARDITDRLAVDDERREVAE